MDDDSATLTSESLDEGAQRGVRSQLAFVVAWCDEPHRVGEVLFPVQRGPCVFGRGGPRPDDGDPRVGLVRVRPGTTVPSAPLTSPALSRRQLRIEVHAGSIEVSSLGRAPLRVDGREVERTFVEAGSVVEVGSAIMLLCTPFPHAIPGSSPLHRFGEPDSFGIVGESPAVWELRRQIRLLRPHAQHVLVRGETGTGKEIVAAALRGSGPWVARNAATLPEGLVDAELFGNVAGYPNPQMREREGLIGAASGGVLFLDEIAELPESLQAHLLRVLDSGEYQRLGESRMRRANLRVVVATNRDEASLKHDVLARFPFRLELPPLRERRSDVPLLVQHVLRGIAAESPELRERFFDGDRPRIAPAFLRRLVQHDHPENVRGLRTALWASVVESSGNTLAMPAMLQGPGVRAAEPAEEADPGEISPEVVQACLDEHNGNQEQTWRALGLASRHVLARLIRKHGLVVRRRG
ncbi:MAG: sigma 54-interacting transcriptional regulator [Myxococcota bacterium]